MSALVFLDCETTGLSLDDDIWEFAAVRRGAGGAESELHLFIDHARAKCAELPDSFLADHYARWPGNEVSVGQDEASQLIFDFMQGRPHIVGAVPNFDTERVAKMLHRFRLAAPWHYHLIDVENLAVGYLNGTLSADRSAGLNPSRKLPTLPWDSDVLSLAVGVDPERFERHTAMGDVRWAMAIYDAITASVLS